MHYTFTGWLHDICVPVMLCLWAYGMLVCNVKLHSCRTKLAEATLQWNVSQTHGSQGYGRCRKLKECGPTTTRAFGSLPRPTQNLLLRHDPWHHQPKSKRDRSRTYYQSSRFSIRGILGSSSRSGFCCALNKMHDEFENVQQPTMPVAPQHCSQQPAGVLEIASHDFQC